MKRRGIEKMIDRIIQITIKLAVGEKINIKEESILYDVSEKTISRDIKKIEKHMFIKSEYLSFVEGERKKKYFYKG